MGRDTRDERELSEQEPLGRMLLSQGRSGGNAASGDQERPKSNTAAARNIFENRLPDPEREILSLRNREYRITGREFALMTDIGMFRTVAIGDLAEYKYSGNIHQFNEGIRGLKAQNLISQRRVMVGKGREKFSVLVLTKEGKKVLSKARADRSGQAFYSGFVKPQEVAHDAAIYRMYQVEAAEIERRGGRIRRVVLDYELKKKVYSPLAKVRSTLPPLEYKRRQTEIAAENGLKVVRGKIPLPDLRIEYETVEGERTKVDVELATEHYHGRHAAEKLRAGFKTYADRVTASRLNAALTYGHGSPFDPELMAGILSL